MNIVRAVRLWTTVVAAAASISSITISGALAETVASYTQAQADRGKKAYDVNCSGCHGATFGGGGEVPALVGAGFREHWFVGSPGPFMQFISSNMPQQDPGTLDPQTYADIAAFLMSKNRVKAGDTELSTDPAVLANVTLPPLQ